MNIQQGDVLLRSIATDWSFYGVYPRMKGKRLVLAKGETTGHSHVLVMEKESDAELIQMGETIRINLKNQGVIEHEEHKPVTVPAGIYEVGQAKEFDYAAEHERQVQD